MSSLYSENGIFCKLLAVSVTYPILVLYDSLFWKTSVTNKSKEGASSHSYIAVSHRSGSVGSAIDLIYVRWHAYAEALDFVAIQ